MRRHDAAPQIIVGSDPASFITGQCDCACDCACAEPVAVADASQCVGSGRRDARPTNFQTASEMSGPLAVAPDALTLPLTADYRLLFSPLAARPAVVNLPALDLWRAFAQPRPADAAFALFPDMPRQAVLDVLRQMAALALLRATSPLLATRCAAEPRTLIAWLHVTNDCNLRCAYCYLDKTAEAMSDETGHAAIQAVFRSARAGGLRAIKLKYAGGEPTLNLPLVLQLHRQAQSLAERHSVELDGVILSNGVNWTPQMIRDVSAHGIRVMISLDGIGRAHDAQRAFINGRGSFALVSRSVDRLLAHGITPDISITVSDHNVDDLPDLLTWILERDLPFSLNFYRENGGGHERNERKCPAQDLRLSEQRIIAGMKSAYAVIGAHLPRRSLAENLLDRANLAGPHHHTCAAGRNYLVIDHRGQIAKCQMDLRHPATDIHAADPLALVRSSPISFQNVDVDEKEGCRDCQWRYGCAGGCPLQTYRATGRCTVKSPNCNIYQALFPEILRLEGLRLLKYAET